MISLSAAASLASSSRPRGSMSAEPLANSTSDWNTNRSPTIRTSSRSPRARRSSPKNSERYCASSSTLLARATLSRWPRSAMVAALRVDLRLLEVQRLVQGRELPAQGRDLLGQLPHLLAPPRRAAPALPRRACPRGRASCAAAPRSAGRGRQARAGSARSSARRRRASPRARWRGRGSSRSRPAGAAAPRRWWRGWSTARRPCPRDRRARFCSASMSRRSCVSWPSWSSICSLPACTFSRASARSRSRSARPTCDWPSLSRISSSVRCISAWSRLSALNFSASWARAASLSPRSAESMSRSRNACCRSALIRAMVGRRSAAASCSSPSCEVRSCTWPCSRCTASVRPCSTWPRKNCASTNTTSRKMIDRTSVDSASTKPGQMSTFWRLSRRTRATR